MIDRERLRTILGARYAHRHEGYGWRLLHNDLRFPPLLAATVRDAYARTGSFFEGLAETPSVVDVLVRSARAPASEPRALYVPPATAGRPVVFLNLYNRDRLPLDSAFFWETIRAVAAHEFAHAFLDRAVGHRPLPSWMEEGTARYVERTVAPRTPLARGPGRASKGPPDAYGVGHAAVEYVIARFGVAAWLDALREVARYLDAKRDRAKKALAVAAAGEDEVRSRHSRDVNRHLDRLLARRFGVGAAAIARRLKEPDPLDRPAAPNLDPFDRLVAGRLDAGPAGAAEVAVALLSRPHLEAPVLTAVARGRSAVRALLARAHREGRPVHGDALLAFRLATGAFLHRPIAPHLRRAVVELRASTDDPHRANLPAEDLVLVRAGDHPPIVLAGRQGLHVHLGTATSRRVRALERSGARVVEDAGLLERIAGRLVPGECPPTAWGLSE